MTRIYATYEEFQRRTDKSINGVSPRFAKENPEWERDNETNIGCWNCRGCRGCRDCRNCSNCWDCWDCWNCYDCVHCWSCSNCWDCCDEDCEEGLIRDVPVIENIHQKVYEAASRPDALDMAEWHTCETTHCRAGWVIHLAGEPGYKLERVTSTARAALLIYEASSPIPVDISDFHVTNEEALESMREAAEAEKELNKGKP